MIRPARPEDSEAITSLLTQLGYPSTSGLIAQRLPSMLDHPDQRIWIYETKNIVAGFVSVHLVPQIALKGAIAIISYLAVDEKFRNKGIGARLEQECTRFAISRECDVIQLHCHSRREDAHRFYERHGYEESRKYFTKYLDA